MRNIHSAIAQSAIMNYYDYVIIILRSNTWLNVLNEKISEKSTDVVSLSFNLYDLRNKHCMNSLSQRRTVEYFIFICVYCHSHGSILWNSIKKKIIISIKNI